MPDIWLKRDVQGAQWAKHTSAPAVQRYLAALDDDVKLWPEQSKRLAGRNATKYGWCFSCNGPVPNSNLSSPIPLARPPSKSTNGFQSVFQSPNKSCAACGANLAGHIKQCGSCGNAIHKLCGTDLPTGFSCYGCVCIACKADLISPMETCSNCKLVVHQACCCTTSGNLLCHSCSPLAPKPPPLSPLQSVPLRGNGAMGDLG